jgi:Zn finger protein HypA/HybF involved in hydrogenase expression
MDDAPAIYTHEWEVECPECGTFTVIQKSDPVLCPNCLSTEIDTTPLF